MLTGKAKIAGVMGWPVGHSLSPLLHGFWLAQHKIDGTYIPLAVHPENFEQAFRALPKLGFQGVNITVPHKEKAFALCDDLDDAAKAIGAVNTVHIVDGMLRGSNTDGFGFFENLRDRADPKLNTQKSALILGAGGAARSIIYALIDAGLPEIRITNRTRARAEMLAQVFGPLVTVVDWDDRGGPAALGSLGLLVNTTSLGMTGQPPLEMALDNLDPKTLVTDIVYAPLITDLLRSAQDRGNPIVDGLGMLLHQARPGFEKWFGKAPMVSPKLRQFILDHMAQKS